MKITNLALLFVVCLIAAPAQTKAQSLLSLGAGYYDIGKDDGAADFRVEYRPDTTLIWKIKPDLIIETGIAHGGSLVLSASMLAMLDYCDALEAGEMLDPARPKRKVVGVDIDIREHNRKALDAHPMRNRMELIEGSSIAPEIIARVHEHAKDKQRVMVCLDSMHTHDHVLAELEAYAPLVSKNSYCCVFDTIIEDMPDDMFPDRPWSKGNNPKTAVWQYLKSHPEFEIDKQIENKLLITVAPDGYLKRIA